MTPLFHSNPCVCVCRCGCIGSISASVICLEARCYRSVQPAAADSILTAFHSCLLPFFVSFSAHRVLFSLCTHPALLCRPPLPPSFLYPSVVISPSIKLPFPCLLAFSLCTLIAIFHLPPTLIRNRRLHTVHVFSSFSVKNHMHDAASSHCKESKLQTL